MLRKALPDSVYLWINKMDGLGRRYTEAELEAFAEIDGYFRQELKHYRAELTACADSRFVEADGMMRRCNISRENIGNFYEDSVESKKEELSGCKRKTCSCYLAYCNRRDAVAPFFRPYPAFRIPVYPKAVFFDIDGTLVPEGLRRIPEHTARGLLRLSVRCEIYLATSLPLEAAKRKLSSVWHVFRGGVFANGARWQTQSQEKGSLDVILPMEAGWLTGIKEKQKAYGFKVHVYRKKADIYKVTLYFHRVRRGIQMPEQKQKELSDALKIPDSCRILWEGNCMQITKQGTGKLAGILEICRAMGYRREDVTAGGDFFSNKFFAKSLSNALPSKLSAITLFIRSGRSNAVLTATQAPPLVPRRFTFLSFKCSIRAITCCACAIHKSAGNLSTLSDFPLPRKSTKITLKCS